MARIVGTTGTTAPPRRSHKQPRHQPAPYVLTTPHDVGTTAQPKRHAAPATSNIFGPVKGPSFTPAQHHAAKQHLAAANKLPAFLPKIPQLDRYSAPQRRVINTLMAHSVNANRLPGESAQQALERLGRHPNPQIRQAVQIFNHTSRAEYHHQRGLAYKRSLRQLKGIGIVGDRAKLIAAASLAGAYTPTGQARAAPKPVHQGGVGGAIGTVLGAANLPLAAIGQRFASQLHSVGATGLGGRGLEDLVNAPANVIPGTWALAEALGNAATGHTKQIRQIYAAAKATDPIVHLVTTGDVKGAVNLASQHPGLTALELYGGAGAADRALGIAARGGRVAELRPFQGVPGTNLEFRRRYSRGYVVSKVQKRNDAADARGFQVEMDAARREHMAAQRATAEGDHAAAVTHHAAEQTHLERARSVDPTLVRGRDLAHSFRQSDIRRRADEQEALAQGRRRPNRSALTRTFVGKKALRESKRQPNVLGRGAESEVQGLIVQGIVAPSRVAIARYVQKLAAVRPHLERSRLAANERLTSVLQDFLASGRDPAELVPRALEYSKRQRAQEAKAVAARAADAEEFRMARLKAYAANNMDAFPDEHGRLVVSLHGYNAPDAEIGRLRAELEKMPARDPRRRDLQAELEYSHAELNQVRAAAHGGRGQEHTLQSRFLDAHEQYNNALSSLAKVEARERTPEGAGAAGDLLRERAAQLRAELPALRTMRDTALRLWRRSPDYRPPGAGAATHVTRVLRAADIERHLNRNPEFRKHGIHSGTIAYVTHRPGATEGAFNVRFMRKGGTPPGISTRRRTGRAVLEGTASHGREAMLAGPVRLQGIIDGIRSYQHAISEAAMRDKRGHIVTASSYQRAERLRDNLMLDKNGHPLPGAVPLRIVRLNPMGGREGQLSELLSKIDQEGFVVGDAGRANPVLDSLEEALKGKGEGPYALVPDEYAAQLEAHAQVYRATSPAWRSLTNLFRHAVLPFSPTWLQGNVTEAALRAAIVGAGPRSYLTFRQVLRALGEANPDAAAELLNRLGTGHLGSVDRVAVKATAASFADSPFYGLVKAWEQAREHPVPRTIGNGIGAYTHWMLSTVNGQLEAQFKYAMAGKFIRQNFMDEAGPKLSARAVQQAMEGLRGTPDQVELARWVTRAYGQYEAFSPRMRQLILNYTPFAAWSLNAVKFITSVLPKDHPALTGLLAANDNATRQWRQAHGQDAGHGKTPAWLLQSVPAPGWYAKLTGTPTGSPIRLGRYTPFGFFSDPLGSTADTVLPQLSGVYHAFQGQTPFGDRLHEPRGIAAIKEFGYAMTPLVGQIVRAIGKKGSVPARFRQVLNPLEPSHSTAAGFTPAPGSVKLPKGYDPNKVDWGSVKWNSGGGGGVDWSKVDWGAAK